MFFFILAFSFNQPKFCPTADWNPHGITFVNHTSVGNRPYVLFINKNNTFYSFNREKNVVLMWINNSIDPNKINSNSIGDSYSMFVTTIGDIYIDNGRNYSRVDKLTLNTNTFNKVMSVGSSCFSLFIDINDTLYCSLFNEHIIIKRWLNNNQMASTIAAGTNGYGSALNQLHSPMGIFVDINFDLYVADCGNDRIQLFQFKKLNGKTLVGNGSLDNTNSLKCPSGIVLDNDKYLFIVDHGNHRIIRWGLNSFRCLAGCNSEGSQSNQLSLPISLSFDSYGNIFVTDSGNDRIQKFNFINKSCGKY
ncbi:unnamed protein product [Adineta steineri]|uniref:NHL repeat containing protein-like protein n=1 Tax=Adineta steineri TaxID=433720 RepID=A0A815XB09_9BILA|nr:unnamed protein product [Adineta steineri]CAF1662765.1 unnamed protein product [Adineta steineri]